MASFLMKLEDKMTKTRALICLFTGHVDHGKSRLIEVISDLHILDKEAGQITQTISAVNVGMQRVKTVCGVLMQGLNAKIPGFLLIDSPGHAAFTNLRKRGGNLADIAVLVVDINEGILEQTLEAIDILKQYKTPFIVALNKVDLLPGWKRKNNGLMKNINLQSDEIVQVLDTKIYEIVGKLYDKGFNAERFDRVEDYGKQIAIVPVSAKTKEGVPELLLVLTGLAGKFLEKGLQVEVEKPGKGVILEVKDQKGFGNVLDVILYDGRLNVNDVLVIGNLDEALVTKVRGLYCGNVQVQGVDAAACVRVIAAELKNALPGMPFIVGNKNLEQAKEIVQGEVGEVVLEMDSNGVVVKAESLGSLEALINLLRKEDVKIKRASVGEICKKDIAEAKSEDELNQVILGFNINPGRVEGVEVITGDVIYHIVENYKKWYDTRKTELEAKKIEKLVRPCKLRIIPGYVFRQNNPAVVGVDVQVGMLKVGIPVMDDNGKKITEVKSIQEDGENVNDVYEGKQVSVSLPGVTVGRQVFEGLIMYSDIPEQDFKAFKEMKKFLKPGEINLLKEIADIKRKTNMVWGV